MTPHCLNAAPGHAANSGNGVQAMSPAEVIAASSILHLSAITLALSLNVCDIAFAAMALARAAGTRVSFDSNLRLKLWTLARAQACIAQRGATRPFIG